ncbi:MAG: sulfatase [Candidatus Eisenbacteria bacterium]
MTTRSGVGRRAAALGFAGLLALSCGARERPSGPPPVILISFCSMRADHMGCYGYGRETSPVLDALARKGVLFERAVSPWPKTSPAFSSIMTGAYPHTTGVMWKTAGVRLADEHLTLAEILREKGYATAAFTSSGALGPPLNIGQGFDVYEETWKENRNRSYRLEIRYDRTATEALRWIDAHEGGPFLLWVHFNNAHYPYKAPDELAAPFEGDSLYADTLRAPIGYDQNRVLDLPPGHPNAAQVLHNDLGVIPERGALPVRPGSREFRRDLAHYVARYDAGIRWADRSAAILLEGLEERGLLDRSLTVLFADHGEALGDHDFFFEHGRFVYDDCMKVPLILHDPARVPGGRRIAAPVGVFSILPTILELLGEEVPGSVESPSLLPLLEGRGEIRPVFAEGGYEVDFLTMIRDGEWKMIHAPNGRDRAVMTGAEFELYRPADDPGETRNLADTEPSTADRLRRELLAWEATWRAGVAGAEAPPDLDIDEATLKDLRSMGYVR